MKSNTGRKVRAILLTALTAVLTLAQAGGAHDFGQRAPAQTERTVQPGGGAHDFGQ
ncbi:hypothetical protein [Deinococcus aetherius]|uniref:hypothetical protein n=1 Tax=Deinococcus aetherius TaxID=200252 RepID=UPI00222EE558|nr:hypothetical protein [Deinococcus aetherius]